MAKKAVRRLPQPFGFIEPMNCMPVSVLPEGHGWSYKIKLDGFRLQVLRSGGQTELYSRNAHPLNARFPAVAGAFEDLPDGIALDGELVALGEDGRPNFGYLQNYRQARGQLVFFAFDILFRAHSDVTDLPWIDRRALLHGNLPTGEHVQLSEAVHTSASDMLAAVREHGLEGVIAKHEQSVYEPGQRTGSWAKFRVQEGQEFVIGGYTPGTHGFDALIVGVYRGSELIYAARVRAGFTPALRREIFQKLKPLAASTCPFANLPEPSAGRWARG